MNALVGMWLFQGEKTALFWVGLVVVAFGLTSLLFSGARALVLATRGFSYLQYQAPNLALGIAFTLVGLYLMKSGVKKKE